jgi:hypothetical protein
MDEAHDATPEPEVAEAVTSEPPEALPEPEPEPMPTMEWPKAEPDALEPTVAEATAPEPIAEEEASAAEPVHSVPIEDSIRQSIAARPTERRPPGAPDPEWLRRRRGPAARAYRRLRRLLPG